MILAYYANYPTNILKTGGDRLCREADLTFLVLLMLPGNNKYVCYIILHIFILALLFHILHIRILQLSTHGTSETRQKCLLLVVSRHTITATKVIIKARIIHTCYHCFDAQFWLNIQALIWLFVGVSASLCARLSRKDEQGPRETPRSGRNLSMTRHKESTASELQKPRIQ